MDLQRLNQTTIEITLNRRSVTIGLSSPESGDIRLALADKKDISELVAGYFQEPGEYEVQGVMIDGVQTGEQRVSYHILEDDVACAAVALLKADDLTDAMLEGLQPAQVLFIWLEEGKVADVSSLLSRFEASVLVPVKIPVALDELEKALHLPTETTKRTKLVMRDLTSEQPRLILLT